MKKNYIILLIALIMSVSSIAVQAQPDKGERAERIEAMKVSFITDELNLSPEEAQKFWPLYNAFEDEKRNLMHTYNPRAGHSKKSLVDISKEEANTLINNEIAFLEKRLEITKKYIASFKTVLSDEKVALLLTLENKFKRLLIDRMKKG